MSTKSVSRRKFVKNLAISTAASSLGVLAIGESKAAEFTLKFANNLPTNHPMNLRAQEMVAKIASESGGRVQIRIYPNSQLGSDTDVLSQVRAGAVDYFMISPLILGTFLPAVQISNVGFAFKDYEHVWAAMDGKLGEHVRKQISASQTLFAFDRIWDNGYRHVTTKSKPIITPEDLTGRKIRVMPSAMSTSVFRSFGASPVSINWAETYSALQTGVVDGQENPLIVISTAKIYEVQKYCTFTKHVWDGFWCIGNKRSFAKLPQDLQQIVARNINEAALKQRDDIRKLDGNQMAELKAKGMVFNEANLPAFQAKLRSAGFYDEWRKKFGAEAWGILEGYTGKLL